MSAASWGDAHRRESALVLLDEARTLLLDGDTERARDAANEATAVLAGARDHAGTSADHLRNVARDLGLWAPRLVRRVRALAEGRLVREPALHLVRVVDRGGGVLDTRKDKGNALAEAREDFRHHIKKRGARAVRVRVTRIRRAR